MAKVAERKKEFQAVILAGGTGSRMYPLSEGELPKSFLPVANRPLITYQIEFFQRSGFKDLIIVTNERTKELLHNLLKGEKYANLSIQYVVTGEDLGTAESLQLAKPFITTDFVLIGGDLIVEPSFLKEMLEYHRNHDSICTFLLKEIPPLGPKSPKLEMERRDFIGLIDNEEGLKQVVFYQPRSNLGDKTELSLSKKTLIQYPNITVYNNLLDAHLYIFNHWILDSLSHFLADTESSIKCSLLPKLVHLQEEYDNYQRNFQNYQRPLVFPFEASAAAFSNDQIKLNLNQSADNNNNSNNGNENDKNSENEDEEDFDGDFDENSSKKNKKKKKEFYVPEIALKTQFDLSYILSSNRMINIPNLRCLAYILDNNTYCGRANMNHTFHSINLDVAKGLSSYSPNEPKLKDSFIAKSVSIPDSSIIGSCSIVGENTKIGEKTSVKHSVIGEHCVIGNRVKIGNSVILGHVKIGDGVEIQGSILCTNCNIGDGSVLRECTVSHSYQVPKNTSSRGEILSE